ncbi:NUDIX domain-containing protein [Methanofollis formosanus]|uniref:NUDIX domain-containing protein n=1 Tax=Methanofollis formosanus TaxID=299308 RepID=A0A8G1A403_9EURY|nr:NUDIX domain-containing protein [Methanofollis formosanus]QYZ79662.1 NUDIX domain-containing protein [Methanofollis formosanus]
MPSAYGRRRGTAIIETEKGILVVAQSHRAYLLPGGGARPDELQIQSAIRELREETGLYPIEVKYLFKHMAAKIFLMKVKGTPRPRNEIIRIAYYQPGNGIKVSPNTKKIIDQYYSLYASK